MTSLEIAELTGKNHFDLMRAIRNMEPAWKNVCGRNFALTSRTIVRLIDAGIQRNKVMNKLH